MQIYKNVVAILDMLVNIFFDIHNFQQDFLSWTDSQHRIDESKEIIFHHLST